MDLDVQVEVEQRRRSAMHIGITAYFTDEGVPPAVLARAAEESGLESLYVPSHSHIPAKRETSHPMLGIELPRTCCRALGDS
jgi:alkanesulfonate monooxygenase SsuD/methylene tetrahydromethanopterin reductase-like flavin-dependent oxidoreductase (luciferase family)